MNLDTKLEIKFKGNTYRIPARMFFETMKKCNVNLIPMVK